MPISLAERLRAKGMSLCTCGRHGRTAQSSTTTTEQLVLPWHSGADARMICHGREVFDQNIYKIGNDMIV